MGDLELYLIYSKDGVWEPQWRALQGSPITSLLTVVSKEDMDHALYRWSKPLVQQLGIPPDGALRKLPHPVCFQRGTCPLYDAKHCVPRSKILRVCFEPEGIEEPEARKLASDLIRLWKEGVYIVLVQDKGVPSV